MFLNIFSNALIIFIVIIFFLVAVIANGLTKSPDNIELPEECSACHSKSCIIKFDRNPRKETILEYYEKCEDITNGKEAN